MTIAMMKLRTRHVSQTASIFLNSTLGPLGLHAIGAHEHCTGWQFTCIM